MAGKSKQSISKPKDNPTQSLRVALQMPLLESLIELGGSSHCRNEELLRLVASKSNLPESGFIFHRKQPRPPENYELQWARNDCKNHGEIDGSEVGIWRITEKGRERVRTKQEGKPYARQRLPKVPAPSETPVEEEPDLLAQDDFTARFLPDALDSIKGPILIEDTSIHQIATIINSSRHILMTGPPGTGKTTIAINTCEEAQRTNYVSGYIVTTATSDWTTFDTIGGYMPRQNGSLVFAPGIVLRAIRDNKWLVIDEINRADVDKAFGPLLTILSGQSVTLPFADENGLPIQIRRGQGLRSYYDSERAAYFVGDNWRVIGTMNTFDKNSLFYLSYAFMRRFGFVHINNPSRPQLDSIIDGRVKDKDITPTEAENIKHLLTVSPRDFGPAILIDILNYLQERKDKQAFFESLVAYILPQFEGMSSESLITFYKQIAANLDSEETRLLMKRYLSELFDIDKTQLIGV